MTDDRFIRTKALLGEEGLQKLKDSVVMIVGLGAVGGYALEAIARSGVGHLILVDFDRFDLSNINRQILALSSTIGEKKTEAALKRVIEINPKCEVELEDVYVTNENINKILDRKIDFVIDAIDSISSKCELITTLQEKKIPFISSMGAALKTDVSCIKTGRLSQTINCKMARCIRQNLKKRGVKMDEIVCVFSTEQYILPENAVTANPEGGKNILGSLPTITAIFGLTMAHYVIQKLSGQTS